MLQKTGKKKFLVIGVFILLLGALAFFADTASSEVSSNALENAVNNQLSSLSGVGENDTKVVFSQAAPAGFEASIDKSPTIGQPFTVTFWLKDHYWTDEDPVTSNIHGEQWAQGGTSAQMIFQRNSAITYNPDEKTWSVSFLCPPIGPTDYLVIVLPRTMTYKTDISVLPSTPACADVNITSQSSQVFCQTTLTFTAKLKEEYAEHYGIKRVWIHYDERFSNAEVDKDIPLEDDGNYSVVIPWADGGVSIGCEAGPIVTFDAMGGAPTPQSQLVPLNNPSEALVTRPEDPKRLGYSFERWCTDEECTTAFDFTQPISTPLTLYADWTEDHFTVTFDCGSIYTGVKPSAQDCCITQNEGRATAPEISQLGYTFKGWYTNSACTEGSEWNFNNRVSSNMKLYAKWAEDHFTVTFDCGSVYTGVKPSAQNCCITQNEGRATAPEIAQLGYTFKGWYTNSACTEGSEWNFNNRVSSNMKLYAKWAEDHFTVTFDCNDAIYTGEKPASQDCHITLHKGRATQPANLAQTDYMFDGWYTSPEYGQHEKWDFNNRVTSDITLYAKWKADMKLEPSELGSIETHPTNFATVNTEVTVILHPKEHYVPGAPVITDTNGNQIEVKAVSENIFQFIIGELPVTITPVFLQEDCVVSFNTQGGTPTPTDIVVKYSQTIQNTPVTPTRSGYQFLGWFTAPKGGSPFLFGEKGTPILRKTNVLYAHWQQQPESYSQALDSNQPDNETNNASSDGKDTSSVTDYLLALPNRLWNSIREVFENAAHSNIWAWLIGGTILVAASVWCIIFFVKKKKKKKKASCP